MPLPDCSCMSSPCRCHLIATSKFERGILTRVIALDGAIKNLQEEVKELKGMLNLGTLLSRLRGYEDGIAGKVPGLLNSNYMDGWREGKADLRKSLEGREEGRRN